MAIINQFPGGGGVNLPDGTPNIILLTTEGYRKANNGSTYYGGLLFGIGTSGNSITISATSKSGTSYGTLQTGSAYINFSVLKELKLGSTVFKPGNIYHLVASTLTNASGSPGNYPIAFGDYVIYRGKDVTTSSKRVYIKTSTTEERSIEFSEA